jgi:phosphotriesterase-related protein
LGITLPHEHLLFDTSAWCVVPEEATKRGLAESPVSMANLGELRRDPLTCRDNLKNYDLDLTIKELLYYKRAGGKSLVDMTCIGLGRDPLALRGISLQTGINIVAGCGFYVDATHPKRIQTMNEEQLAQEIVNDLTQGMSGTDVKSGIIGEIGTSYPITPNEEKVLRASAIAQQKTKLTISIHPYMFEKHCHKILDIMEKQNVEPSKIVLCHIDESGFDMDYHKSLAKRGAYIEYDTFGSEVYFDSLGTWDPRDTERVEGVMKMIENGHVSQLLLSHDVFVKTSFRQYGGYGYDHILTHIVPMLRKKGVSQSHIDQMLIENPKKILAI